MSTEQQGEVGSSPTPRTLTLLRAPAAPALSKQRFSDLQGAFYTFYTGGANQSSDPGQEPEQLSF